MQQSLQVTLLALIELICSRVMACICGSGSLRKLQYFLASTKSQHFSSCISIRISCWNLDFGTIVPIKKLQTNFASNQTEMEPFEIKPIQLGSNSLIHKYLTFFSATWVQNSKKGYPKCTTGWHKKTTIFSNFIICDLILAKRYHLDNLLKVQYFFMSKLSITYWLHSKQSSTKSMDRF